MLFLMNEFMSPHAGSHPKSQSSYKWGVYDHQHCQVQCTLSIMMSQKWPPLCVHFHKALMERKYGQS